MIVLVVAASRLAEAELRNQQANVVATIATANTERPLPNVRAAHIPTTPPIAALTN